jgi:hypothetical protein
MSDDWGILSELPFTQDEIKALTRLPRVVEYIEDLQNELEQAKQVNLSLKGKRQKRLVYCIAQICPKTKKQLQVYKNIGEASIGLGCSKENVRRALTDRRKTCKGYYIRKLDNYKICNSCGFEGDRDENFDKAGVTKSGTQSYKGKCKKCISKINRKYKLGLKR